MCIANAARRRRRASTIENLNPVAGVICLWHSITTASPIRRKRSATGRAPYPSIIGELHQEGEAANDQPIGSTPPTTPELTDEEVAVLCDIERDGSIHPHKQPMLQHLRERGFVAFSEEPLAKVKLTSHAQQLLSKRGVGLNES